MSKCSQCPKKINPVEVMLGTVCGNCVRKTHRRICQQTEDKMNIQEFTQKYKDRENLYGISWSDFPAELQEACQRFIDEWKENLYIDDIRNLSGFNEMSVDDLLRYAKGKLPDEDKPLGSPYKR